MDDIKRAFANGKHDENRYWYRTSKNFLNLLIAALHLTLASVGFNRLQCFQECKHRGIPCCGCSKALYCNENCRWLAWQSYHWLECCMGPVLEKVCKMHIVTVCITVIRFFRIENLNSLRFEVKNKPMRGILL